MLDVEVSIAKQNKYAQYAQITRRQNIGPFQDERSLSIEDIIDTLVGVEGEFGSIEGRNGPVSPSTTLNDSISTKLQLHSYLNTHTLA